MTHEKRRYSAEDKLIENGGFSYKDDTQSLKAELDRLREALVKVDKTASRTDLSDYFALMCVLNIARKALEEGDHG